jgi:hypothetical protein
MQFIESLIGVSPDGGSGVLELWLFCFAGVMFGLGRWWKYWIKLAQFLAGT